MKSFGAVISCAPSTGELVGEAVEQAGRRSPAARRVQRHGAAEHGRPDAEDAVGERRAAYSAPPAHAAVGTRRQDDLHPGAGVRRPPTAEPDQILSAAVQLEGHAAQRLHLRAAQDDGAPRGAGSKVAAPSSAASGSKPSTASTVTAASRCAVRPA